MVKIRISYNNDKELLKVLGYLTPVIDSMRKSKSNKTSEIKRAYIDTNICIK